MNLFTTEEMALLCLYDTSSRANLLNDLYTVRPYIDDPEMLALSKSAASKLIHMSKEDFDRIVFKSPLPQESGADGC